MQVTIPHNELYTQLFEIGWELHKLDFKNGVYVAKARNRETGQDMEANGKTPEMATLGILRQAQRANGIRRFAALQKFGAWSSDWLDQKEEIAKAYSQMPAFDEKAIPAWQALAAESKVQADAIRAQIQVEVVDDPEPYHSAQEMCEDVHKNKHFSVSRANSDHPLWSVEDNINFRIVHDVLGHCQSGGDFSWRGENLACGVHFPLVSPLAREALFTECIGQVAYRSHYRGFGPQKIGLLSDFLHHVQEQEGEHVYVPHGGLPNLQPSPNMSQGGEMLDQAAGMQGIYNTPGSWVDPNQFKAPPSPAFGLGNPVMDGYRVQTATKNVSPNLPYDPNQHWTSGHDTEFDPESDYINLPGVIENAAKIDTEWQNEDEATQNRAIMQAFRVALLSPRKHLKWNAAHAQALMHTDPSTKAVDLWHMLESERERHNQALGYPEGSHLGYQRELDFLTHELQNDNPGLSEAEALKEAKEVIFKKTKEFEERLSAQEDQAEKFDPTYKRKTELRIYNMARKMVAQWLKDNYSPLRGWQPGQLALTAKQEDAPWESYPAYHYEGSDYWPNYPEPGTWHPDGRTCFNCKSPNLHIEHHPGDTWQRQKFGPHAGHQEWHCKDCSAQGYYYPDPEFEKMVRREPEIERGEPDPETGRSTLTMHCKCGNSFELWNSWANECDVCGREYNGSGQMLAPRSQWGEETGEGWTDDSGNFHTDFEKGNELDYNLQWGTANDPKLRPKNNPIDEWLSKTADQQALDIQDVWHPQDSTGFAAEESKYGAFMGTHLDAIEEVGKHIDEIRELAHEDLNKGGHGFIFRNGVMNMNLKGVNPKVASFAWLLLAPLSSELGIVDAHVLRGLRREESDINPRDYYKLERMQRSAKDATGYKHVPLGLYHWGLWDQIRNPGKHSDHSPLRVLDPTPWDKVQWDAAMNARSGPWEGPKRFEDARGHMEQAALDFDRDYGSQPKNMVPLTSGPGQSVLHNQPLHMIPRIV